MTNVHTYATGAALGTRSQWTQIGGTDSMPGVEAADTTGTVAVVSSSSLYGPQAVQVTTATSGDATRVKIPKTNGMGEFRVHVVFDQPALAGQAWCMFTMYAAAGEFQVWTSSDGSFGPWAGSDLYKSPAAAVPAAGERTRLSMAFMPGAAGIGWRVGLYNDATGALLTSGSGTTAAVTGALGDMFFGKTAWSSGPTAAAFNIRAIRVEEGPGASLALLPAETDLAPKTGAAVVPIRVAGWSGAAPAPAGVAAVAALADADPATRVQLPEAGTVRVALTPMQTQPGGTAFVLDPASAVSAHTLRARLYRSDGERVGTDKTAPVSASAEPVTVQWAPSETAGMTVADWEAPELEFGTGPLGPMAGAGTWVPGWSDEFTTPGTPSTATWSTLRGDPATGLYDAPYSTANDASSWDPAYATVTADGLLELRWDNTPSESGGVAYPYTAGIVTSEGRRAFTPPVYIETRVSFTDTPGLWPAVWLNAVGQWPPEIDIAEFIPDDTPDGLYHAHFNYHWGTQAAPVQAGWKWYGREGQTAAGSWHTYGLLWTADRLQVFHDAAPGPSYVGSVTTLPHFLILSTGVRKGQTPANGRMLVDYVRTWTPGA